MTASQAENLDSQVHHQIPAMKERNHGVYYSRISMHSNQCRIFAEKKLKKDDVLTVRRSFSSSEEKKNWHALMERFHMTSWPPYWCYKKILWELNSFLM